MATDLIRRNVDGHTYEFEQFGAKESLKVLARLCKLLGKPFILSIGAFKGKDKKLDTNILSDAASLLFQSIDETETIALFEKLTAEKAICDGKKIDFDRHYEGKLTHLFKVFQAALDVQYGNFFVALTDYLDAGKVASIPEK